MAALEWAIQHLHALSWAHNDLTPYNIMVNGDGLPVLIDFGGCRLIGTHLKYTRGTKEWIDGRNRTSDAEHDVSALVKLGAWLDKPAFTVKWMLFNAVTSSEEYKKHPQQPNYRNEQINEQLQINAKRNSYSPRTNIGRVGSHVSLINSPPKKEQQQLYALTTIFSGTSGFTCVVA